MRPGLPRPTGGDSEFPGRGRTLRCVNVVLVVVVVVLAVLALVVGVTGLLALLGRLPGNGVLGVRTPETRKSPEAWQTANRAAGPAFLVAGLVLGLGALALGLIGGWVGALVVVVALLASLALLNVAGLAGSRAAAVWKATRGDDEGCCGDSGCGCGDAGHAPSGGAAAGGESSDPAADCGVSGGCGSCALNGMCEPESARPAAR